MNINDITITDATTTTIGSPEKGGVRSLTLRCLASVWERIRSSMGCSCGVVMLWCWWVHGLSWCWSRAFSVWL